MLAQRCTPTPAPTLARQVRELEVSDLRRNFRQEVKAFLEQAGVPLDTKLKLKPGASNAAPAYIVTGATFTAFDPEIHKPGDSHAYAAVSDDNETRYLMNNTAAIFERLVQSGERVVVHTKDPALVERLTAVYGAQDRVRIISGELGGREILGDLYKALEDFAADTPISTLSMALYQSFAQNNGEPFKPMHREDVAEIERAAARRLNFVYNMAAMGYDLLLNRDLDDLRIVSLSALAGTRATYGLIADAADKFMNELAWRTFHLEANMLTEKSVTLYQVNPGITTACDVYDKPDARQLVKHESIADGFPLDDDVFLGKKELPQLNSHDVAWVVDTLMRTPDSADPNEAMPDHIKPLLYGGFEPGELHESFEGAIKQDGETLEIDPDRRLPEHILTPLTSYGRLPREMRRGDYRRISMSPPGQRF